MNNEQGVKNYYPLLDTGEGELMALDKCTENSIRKSKCNVWLKKKYSNHYRIQSKGQNRDSMAVNNIIQCPVCKKALTTDQGSLTELFCPHCENKGGF